jgi:hypothetical protein
MNWLIIAGIVVIGVGTLLLTYGGIFQSRKDTERTSKASETRLDEISRDLAELRGKPTSELAPDAIPRVEGEIREWAETFASEKQRKKLLLEERRSKHDSSLQHANSLAKDYFVFFISVIREIVSSYPSSLQSTVIIPEVPTDLFVNPETRFETDIRFSETSFWKIVAYTGQPSPDVGAPIILIYLLKQQNQPSKGENGEFMLRFNNTSQAFYLRIRGDFRLATPIESVSKPTTEYDQTIKSVLRSLIEYQLLQE